MYPNGGSCKLCGETTYLAKDCDLRKKTGQFDIPTLDCFVKYVFLFFRLTDVSVNGGAAASFLGAGYEAGADEDDFHMPRRKNLEIDGDEREDAGVVWWDFCQTEKGGVLLLNPGHDATTILGSGAEMVWRVSARRKHRTSILGQDNLSQCGARKTLKNFPTGHSTVPKTNKQDKQPHPLTPRPHPHHY